MEEATGTVDEDEAEKQRREDDEDAKAKFNREKAGAMGTRPHWVAYIEFGWTNEKIKILRNLKKTD